jgi:hypothetical protein
VYLFQFVNPSSATYKKRDQLMINVFEISEKKPCLQYNKMRKNFGRLVS